MPSSVDIRRQEVCVDAQRGAPEIPDARLLSGLAAAPADTTNSLPPCLSTSRPLCTHSNAYNNTWCSVILGRAIKNEYLALGTIFGTAGIAMLSMGGKKEATTAKPTLQQVKESVSINASSKYVVLSLFLAAVNLLERVRAFSGRICGMRREEEDLYVPIIFYADENGLSTSDQDEQYQAVYCGCGEGVQTLSLLCWLVSHSCSCLIETLPSAFIASLPSNFGQVPRVSNAVMGALVLCVSHDWNVKLKEDAARAVCRRGPGWGW